MALLKFRQLSLMLQKSGYLSTRPRLAENKPRGQTFRRFCQPAAAAGDHRGTAAVPSHPGQVGRRRAGRAIRSLLAEANAIRCPGAAHVRRGQAGCIWPGSRGEGANHVWLKCENVSMREK